MTNFSQNQHQLAFVGKDVAKTAGNINTLNDGEIGVFTPGGVRYTEATADAGDLFYIVLGKGNGAFDKTPVISLEDVTGVSINTYVAPVEQLDFIGFNGVAGSIEVNNNTNYRATVTLNSGNLSYGTQYIKDLIFASDANATQLEIAEGLMKSGAKNMSRDAVQPIAFGLLSDEAGTALGTGVGTGAFVNGSNVVTFGTDVTDATTNAVLAVGNYFKVGAATTDPIYKIVAIDVPNETITLDRPYAGVSAAAIANNAMRQIPAATADASECGVSLTTIAPAFVLGKTNPEIVRWSLSLAPDAFGVTTLTSTAAEPGNGTYAQVAALEHFTVGNNGEDIRDGGKNSYGFTSMATVGATYDMIDITFDKGRKGLIATSNPQTISLIINTVQTAGTYTLAGTADDITDVLEDLLEGAKLVGGGLVAGGSLALA
jgi:hypothetical protein